MKKVISKPLRLSAKVARRIVKLDDVMYENERLKDRIKKLEEASKPFGWPNGHFYSPVHNLEDLVHYDKVQSRSKNKVAKAIPGMTEKGMAKEFEAIKPFFKDFDYPFEEDGESRFYTNNISYPTLDALGLFSMIRRHKPRRIIEIGSGFSSGLMMSVNEKYFNNKINLTFIEPYPELLYERMRKGDRSRYKVIPSGVQDVPLTIFKQLKKDDILFIDSTHVSKFNSDVNYEIFDILPELNKGVIIHFHDVFEGFEYPLDWLKQGWAWNEDYLLRAFLMNNPDYKVLIINDYLTHHEQKALKQAYPRKGQGVLFGGSLWLRKI